MDRVVAYGNEAYKLKGIRQYVYPYAVGTHLATRTPWVAVWDDKHGHTWSGQHMYHPDEILWSRRRRA